MLKIKSIFACSAVPEGECIFRNVIPIHLAVIPRPDGSLVMFVTCSTFHFTKVFPLIVVPTFCTRRVSHQIIDVAMGDLLQEYDVKVMVL